MSVREKGGRTNGPGYGEHMNFVHMFEDGVQEKLALVRASVNIDLPSVVRPQAARISKTSS